TGGCRLPGLWDAVRPGRTVLQPVWQAGAVVAMNRRTVIACLATIAGPLLSGCAERPLKPPDDRSCCELKTKTVSKPMCTPAAVPDLAADAQAKKFEPVPGSLVVYLVRRRWGD